MSTLEGSQMWTSIRQENVDSKYEKCRNITEEIYKRINITFQIKKLETETQSDISDQSDAIDSNDLSNGTDLFACEQSPSISSSTEAEKPPPKYFNNNNNNNNNDEKTIKPVVASHTRQRKRFRKRVKKRPPRAARSDTEASSDEAAPLARLLRPHTARAHLAAPATPAPPTDMKPKIHQQPERKTEEPIDKPQTKAEPARKEVKTIDKSAINLEPVVTLVPIDIDKRREEKAGGGMELKHCTLCSLSFRGDRGLRRHMTMSHIVSSDESKMAARPEHRERKPA